MNLPNHRQTFREQLEADALRRNRDFLLAIVLAALFFLLEVCK